ncbi:PQQ-dependent sugar dehydrogenase [Candidatus Thioglobus sp.]|nr:PQQ-dependent sugar dehydrogenase [Candidatus Thioglobus sp.]
MKFFCQTIHRFIIAGCALFLFPVDILAATYQVTQVATGLGIPWGMSFQSENEILFTERKGRLGIVNIDSGEVNYLSGLPEIIANGQGGFMDVAKPTNNEIADWTYFTYVKPIDAAGNGETTLARAHISKDGIFDWQDLLVTHSLFGVIFDVTGIAWGSDRHFGSRIAFDDTHLYFSVGDRGNRPNGQNLETHAGSILRLNVDGSVPQDNPFVDVEGARNEIWSYGHRNPQGLVWDVVNQRLWSIEHGPRGGDELNLIERGANYGWPIISYGKEYASFRSVGEGTHKEGMEQPKKFYIPSIAPGSLMQYTGEVFPEWQGDLFAGALKLRHINRIELDQEGNVIGEERLMEDLNERIRALLQSPEGWIYFSTDSGNIYVIKP